MAINVRKTKLGKPRYVVRVSDEEGSYYPCKTFKTIRDAEQYEHKLKARKYKKEQAISSLKRNLEFHTYFYEWLESRRHKLSEGWFNKTASLSEIYILPILGEIKLSELRAPSIGKVLSKMKDLKRSEQTRLHVFNIMSKSLKDAVEYFGYLDRNPVSKQDRPKVHPKEREYLKPEEAWKLLNHCKDHYLGPAIWISMLASPRPSEVQALQWKGVDFEKGQILISRAFKRAINKIEPYPKQKDWLILPMPNILAEYLKQKPKGFSLGFAAPAMRGGMLDYNKFNRGLKKLCLKAGVKKVTPHELRHSCTEIWCRNGASLEDIRRLLGHKSVATTMRYIHKTDDRLKKIAAEIRF